MKPNLFGRALLLGWLTLVILLSAFSNRFSWMQSVSLSESFPWRQEAWTAFHLLPFLLDLLGALTGIGLFSLAVFLSGALFFRWEEFSLAKVLTAFVLGEILFSLLFLSWLTLWGLEAKTTALWLSIGALAGLAWLILQRRRTPHRFRVSFPAEYRSFPGFLCLFLFLAGAALSSARLNYDSVAYYFAHAKLMALTGEPLFFYPGDAFVVSSFHPGILFTAVIQLFGDQAARLLSWVNGLAILLLGMETGRKVGLSRRAGLYFAVLMLTSTAFTDLLGDGKVELVSTAPIVAALWWMADSHEAPSRGRFALIGVLLGFAMIARPYNLFLLPVFVILFYLFQIWVVWRTGGIAPARRLAGAAGWMIPTLLMMGAFHLWQNWLWLGSPLAPLFYAQTLRSGDWQWQFDPAILNLLRLLYPLTITFANNPQSLGTISPLFVGFLPFLFSRETRRCFDLPPSLRPLLLAALATLLLWIALFFTVVEIRYIFFLWVLFFLAGGKMLEVVLDAPRNRFGALPRLLLVSLLAFTALRSVGLSLTAYAPLDKQTGQARCYDLPHCRILTSFNQSAAEGRRVFVLDAYRYYLRPDLFACSSRADDYATLQPLLDSPSEFWSELYHQGFEYLTYEEHFALYRARFGGIPDPALAPPWLQVRPVAGTPDDPVQIYRLEATRPPFLPLSRCERVGGVWRVISDDSQPISSWRGVLWDEAGLLP